MKPRILLTLLLAATTASAATKPVPDQCTASVNSDYAAFVSAHAGQEADQDNLMVCGTALTPSYAQKAGRSGSSHHVILLALPTASGSLTIELDTNDELDGIVTASKGDAIYAYGQAYIDPGTHTKYGFTTAAGLHEPHCATHTGADDGWVVVAGKKYPTHPCATN
jgi:hypothetical protein